MRRGSFFCHASQSKTSAHCGGKAIRMPAARPMLRPSHFILLLACVLTAASAARARADDLRRDISFRNDVMAVLSKAGCNAGACHGNKSGKGGSKLSLRGQDPDLDYLALTSDLSGRRINPIEPDKSLILLKPTTQVAHEGGLRFRTDSIEYQILCRW